MKKAILVFLMLGWLSQACKKEDDPAPPEKNNALSFKMNGTLYQFAGQEFSGGGPNGNPGLDMIYINALLAGPGEPSQMTHVFPYQFRVTKINGVLCGALVPKAYPWPFSIDCEQPEKDLAGNPLAKEKVYYLETGSLSYTKKDCGNRDNFSFACWCRRQAEMCDVSGVFNLTFKNGLNEMIALSEGKFSLYNVLQ